jgi:hypothetical protein
MASVGRCRARATGQDSANAAGVRFLQWKQGGSPPNRCYEPRKRGGAIPILPATSWFTSDNDAVPTRSCSTMGTHRENFDEAYGTLGKIRQTVPTSHIQNGHSRRGNTTLARRRI